jgi:hypothetical protein
VEANSRALLRKGSTTRSSSALVGLPSLNSGTALSIPGRTSWSSGTPSENWLELEVGASVLTAPGGVSIPIDLLVKKPFTLSRWAEFMVGLGPEVVQVTGANKGTYFGGEVAVDFMFWPWGKRVGLWVEPEYDLTYQHGASSGIGTTGGVLLGW